MVVVVLGYQASSGIRTGLKQDVMGTQSATLKPAQSNPVRARARPISFARFFDFLLPRRALAQHAHKERKLKGQQQQHQTGSAYA